MLGTSLLGAVGAACFLQGTDATPISIHNNVVQKRNEVSFNVKSVEATSDATPLVPAKAVLGLTQVNTTAEGSLALHNAIRSRATATTPLFAAEGGAGYAINIDFGGSTFSTIFDTGSSDLWLPLSTVQCVDGNNQPVSQATCGFGPLYSGTFQDGQISDENFNITYASGEFLIGAVGYEDVGIAGITVDHQECALVNQAYWDGDGVTSGLIGFAYPSITSAFEGTDPAVDNQNTTAVPYTNWIFNAIDQGLISPIFSLAIERGSNGGGGQVALGGLPTIPFDQTFTSTPLEIVELTPDAMGATNYSFYTIVPDGFLLSGDEETYYGYGEVDEDPSTDFPAIVDSGTTLLYLPTRVVEEVNALFDPPSVYIEEEGVFENYCDAIPPTFAIRINGTDFYINSEDLLLQASAGGYDPSTGGCLVGVQPGPGINILGDVFLKNVVAVFDIGASEMRFAPHEDY